MDDLPPLQEVLGNIHPPPPTIPPPLNNSNITITAEQLNVLIDASVSNALARRDALATLNSPFNDASAPEVSTVPEKAVSTPQNSSSFSVNATINQSSNAEQSTQPTTSIPISSPVRPVIFDRVPQKDHRKTNAASQSEIIKHCICPKDGDKHSKLFRLHLILRSEGLLTMLLRIRSKPVGDPVTNPYGYQPMRQHDVSRNPVLTGEPIQVENDVMSLHSSSTSTTSAKATLSIVPTSTIWVVEADDMVCYDHDMARLYSLVTLMFHNDYHCHASINSELCADAVYFYESIIKVAFVFR